ncbi:ribonuclease YeeF family protein [Virgibacillus salexigens]|uniref:ribonuclease YeeF family protein n=1 Tax=Virgibacillus massiliensis TaxID=1462526 RepID=UPI00137158B7|nr:T7SS effector LXG polymorphic toxin [Virgibacillus massiliensis]MYL40640.1 hypothetical protein [Virgibacillus massiliensis]
MKVLDVHRVQSGIDYAVKDIESLYGRISSIQRAVRDFYCLDDALKGKAGDAMRTFYNECHQPFLIFLYQSLVDYQNTLVDMKQAIGTYESNTNGFIDQGFLENEVDPSLDIVKTKTIELTNEANHILGSVQDIVAIPKIDESRVVEDVQREKQMIQDVVEELHRLDDYETSQLEQTKVDLHKMRNYISELSSKFDSGDLSVQEFNINAVNGITAYQSIKNSNSKNGKETAEVINLYSIKNLPLYEIEKAKNESLKDMDELSQAILNNSYKDLENGVIDREQYYTNLSVLEKLKGDLSEDELKEDVPDSFLGYLKGNVEKIGTNLGVDITATTLQQVGYGTTKFGGLINIISGIHGPSGSNSFVMINKRTARLSNSFIKNGENIRTAGKVLGRGFMAAGFGVGIYVDLAHKDKTVGEAISHNSAALGVGLGANILGKQAVTAVGTMILGTNPVGWAAIGGVVAGITVTTLFNFAYDTNFLGIQDGVDVVGQKLDEIGENVEEKIKDTVESAGEAIKSGLNIINPMNWGW